MSSSASVLAATLSDENGSGKTSSIMTGETVSVGLIQYAPSSIANSPCGAFFASFLATIEVFGAGTILFFFLGTVDTVDTAVDAIVDNVSSIGTIGAVWTGSGSGSGATGGKEGARSRIGPCPIEPRLIVPSTLHVREERVEMVIIKKYQTF